MPAVMTLEDIDFFPRYSSYLCLSLLSSPGLYEILLPHTFKLPAELAALHPTKA
ncbi:hypothetical protein CCHR01_10861 [Colletotrichum chrysophilum]|uniref:Uncharacterized protein n=1 Tax=Colletotrichum chrysophilum TaxID=1836956 RepID=A0AAD9AEB0_9PEZI|nr:hypothetical protein CCHR01_10861 [Colletotrichum chrysophilum]